MSASELIAQASTIRPRSESRSLDLDMAPVSAGRPLGVLTRAG